jgi:organic radical activating enzyme
MYLSKSCNRSCHYCTAWTLEMRNLTVDMVFLRNVLGYFKDYKMRFNLLGGEPGLIKNLDEVIDEIQKNDNHICAVLSNSFVRKKYPRVLEDPTIYYMEHLVLDFYEDKIEKLGTYDFFEENDSNNYNIIIKTPNYFKYREKYNLDYIDHANTRFKSYNSRSPTFGVPKQESEFTRKICAAFPTVPVIDFEIQKIRHCSKKVISGSRQFDITQENADKMMNYELFEFEAYCKTCTEILPRRNLQHVLDIMVTL